jgi:putative transposase
VVALRDVHANHFRVTAWAISNRIKQDLALRALNMAIALRRPPPGCIHHTDRPSHGLQANRCRATGSQYCAHDYQKHLRNNRLKVSPLADVNIRCRAADERQGQLLRQFCPISADLLCKSLAGQWSKASSSRSLSAIAAQWLAELVWRKNWQTRREVEIALFPSHGLQANHERGTKYINGFYTTRRKHSALGWKSPVAFEQRAA